MKQTSVLLILLIISFNVSAQPGSLDISFGTGGKVVTPIGNWSQARAMAVQNDGKIVVAGYSFNGVKNNFAVARYNTNGTLDLTFGGNGKVTTAIGQGGDYATAIALQCDEKIVVAGYSFNGINDDFAMVRYNTNGSLDLSMGTNGIVTTAITPSFDMVNALAIQKDGKIVLAGISGNGNASTVALARYTTNGNLDPDFNGNGKVNLHIGVSFDNANAVAIQENGKLVIAGYSYNVNHYDFALARFNVDGSLDISFDHDGKLTTNIGTNDAFANAMALQPDGKIVAIGKCYNLGSYDFALTRYNTDGSLDETFDADGKVISSIGPSDDEAFAPTIQADGKIIVTGTSINGLNTDVALARYLINGAIDPSFGINGKVTTSIGTAEDYGYAIKEHQNRILIAGASNNGSSEHFAVVAYQNDLVTLPLKLTNFKATLLNTTAVCTWTTELEEGGSFFVVQKSTNGNVFVNVGQVAGIAGNTQKKYVFNDVLSSLEASEVLYYRLKIISPDAQVTYSPIVTIRLQQKNLVSISPNPATTYTHIKAKNLASVMLLNNAGKLVLLGNVANATDCVINTSYLAKGIYVLRIIDTAGIIFTEKLAVQ